MELTSNQSPVQIALLLPAVQKIREAASAAPTGYKLKDVIVTS